MYNNGREMVALKSTEDVESAQQDAASDRYSPHLVASPLRSALRPWSNLVIRPSR